QQSRVERLVGTVEEAALLRHPLGGEVHVNQPFVDLNNAVLQPGGDAQLVGPHGEGQLPLDLARDGHAVEVHQTAEGGDDDGAGAGQADLPRNVAVIADGEVALVQGKPLADAVLDELLDGRLDQA